MERDHNTIRVGICKYTSRKVLQLRDFPSNDAIDEKGWLCLHDDTEEEEIQNIIKFLYGIDIEIHNN
ncbi:hypothetical protein [Pontibacter fetidus]|uniref:Uncharacterized protein n=1 Tax=Pontibacter fetidus TaxID=2700082 RepID=A0A6B2H0E5_9BACT|nr:hypothetical protein [Pontibacter fetidus]NDK56729.1 hypothetical protein [Pontibacter fetidus]